MQRLIQLSQCRIPVTCLFVVPLGTTHLRLFALLFLSRPSSLSYLLPFLHGSPLPFLSAVNDSDRKKRRKVAASHAVTAPQHTSRQEEESKQIEEPQTMVDVGGIMLPKKKGHTASEAARCV